MWFVMRSMRMKPPVSRFSAYGSKAMGSLELDVDDADRVQLEVVRGDAVERVDVELVLDRRDRGRDRLRADAHEVRAAAQERLVRHPHDRRLELVAHLRRRIGRRDDVAAADVDLVLERERHRLARDRALEVAVEGDDARDRRLLPAREDDDAVAGRNGAARDRPGEAAEIGARPVHPLHRHAEGRVLHALLVDLDRLQVLHERRPAVPRHRVGRVDDVVAAQRRHAG